MLPFSDALKYLSFVTHDFVLLIFHSGGYGGVAFGHNPFTVNTQCFNPSVKKWTLNIIQNVESIV